MIAGFSGFGFPKAHGAAFGLLAYQSTWLRVHYKPEFTCALLNEQPMGFYPSDTLIHECQRTGIEVLPPDVNHSGVLCHVEWLGERPEVGEAIPGVTPLPTAAAVEGAGRPRIRIGLGYLNGARADEVAAIVAEREAQRPVPVAGRAGVARGRGAAGAVRARLVGRVRLADRRRDRERPPPGAVAARARRAGDAARRGRAPAGAAARAAGGARRSSRWSRGSGWWPTTRRPGVTAGAHPMALVREDLPADVVTSADLERLRHGVAGADRRPGRRPPAAGDGERDRVHAARGRARDDQPRRPAGHLRPRPAGRPRGAAGVRRGPAGEAPEGGGGDQHRGGLAPPAGHQPHRRRRRGHPAAGAERGAPTTRWPTPSRSSPGCRPWPRRPEAERPGGGDARDFAAVAPPVQSFAQGRRR